MSKAVKTHNKLTKHPKTPNTMLKFDRAVVGILVGVTIINKCLPTVIILLNRARYGDSRGGEDYGGLSLKV